MHSHTIRAKTCWQGGDVRTGLSIIIYSALIILNLGLTSCGLAGRSLPAAELQQALAAKLADPGVCPSGNAEDVQQTIKLAGAQGIAHLPLGCYRVTTTIEIPACLQLAGAGAEKTILYREPGKLYSGPILHVRGDAKADCVTQISGLSLLGVRDTQDTGEDYGIILTNVQGFRIDHSYFEGYGFAAVRVEGASSGVVDHAIFIDNFKKGIDNLGYGVVVYGTGQWLSEVQPGNAATTFVEDSLFVGNRHAISANNGADYVFRNNQVLGNVEACAVDAHGMGYGSPHGTRYVEIYHNVIRDPVYDECGIGIRGGSGVIYENTIQGYQNPILLILEWGTPELYKAQYPALDQIQELYIWDNQVKGGHAEPRVDETGAGFIEVNRDYFTRPPTAYTPYTYPHPLASGGPFDQVAWPPITSQ
jgi:hypothetical protein